MSRRQQIQRRIRSLGEIKGIMVAMKNLSLLETGRLTRIFSHQQASMQNIEEVISDFLHFWPQPQPALSGELVLVIGSERGFCGNFNEELLESIDSGEEESRYLIVGHRLAAKLSDDPRIAMMMDGPSVSEEVPATINQLMEWLTGSTAVHNRSLKALYHDGEGAVVERQLLPLPSLAFSSGHGYPPRLNLAPALFYHSLLEHYLFAGIYQLFYSSLLAENRRRLQHMEGAIRQMERSIDDSTMKYNALRQEEITEEIEIIMLSADALLESEILQGGLPQA